jgi:hypothetical protein
MTIKGEKMSYADFMNKVRRLDHYVARWMMRHFYLLFFQMVLVAIFIFWFVNVFVVIDTSTHAPQSSLTDRILANHSVHLSIIVFLMLLNSFWVLFMFSSLQRLVGLIKDLNYNINRMRPRDRQ